MARIEAIEDRLVGWAAWVRVQRGVELGYGESPLAGMMRTAIGRGSAYDSAPRRLESAVEDGEAMAMERALAAVKVSAAQGQRLCRLATLTYVEQRGPAEIAQRYRRSRQTVDRWVCDLHRAISCHLDQQKGA